MGNNLNKLRFSKSCLVMAIGLAAGSSGVQAEGFMLEEILVTASKREESIQDSSLIIDAFASDQLQESGIADVSDLSSLVPGLQVGMGGPALQVYIRGVGNPGSAAVSNPAVAVNKAGVYIARSQAVKASFFDLERIEVLKGPQGTLYGRNASGGALNLITKAPDLDEVSGYVSVDVGNYSSLITEAAINIPLSDEFAIRASAQTTDHDGYLSDGTNDEDRYSIRLQALWEPSESFSLLVAGQYAEFDGKGVGYSYAGASDAWEGILSQGANEILLAGAGANGLIAPAGALPPWITSPVVGVAGPEFGPFAGQNLISLVNLKNSDDASQDLKFYDISATLEWEMDFATLTVIPSYQKAEMHYATHPGLRYETVDIQTGEPEESEATSLEVRLSNVTDELKWVAGVYFYNESQNARVYVNQGAVQNVSILADYETDSLGVFGEATYSLTDTTRLIAGLRYSEDDIEKNNFERYAHHESLRCNPFLPSTEIVNGNPTCLISASPDEKVSFDSVDWKIGIEHDINGDSMIFATLATGYKAGGIGQVAGNSFDPEELTSLEIGMRNILMDGRLQLNGDIFYMDYKDHQEFKIGPDELGIIGQSFINSGDATIKGFGLDVVFAATDNDLLSFGLEYLDTEYDDFTYTQASAFTPPNIACPTSLTGNLTAGPQGPVPELLIDCSGFEMNRAAKWSGHADYTHTFDLNDNGFIDANISLNYTDDRWVSASFLPQQRVDAHTIVNARVTYHTADDKLSITGYVKNITEEESFNNSTAHSNVYQLVGLGVGDPRTYGLRVRYNF